MSGVVLGFGAQEVAEMARIRERELTANGEALLRAEGVIK